MAGRTLDDSVVVELVGLIYASAADPSCWTAFLRRFADLTGGTMTTLVAQDTACDKGQLAAAVHIDPSYQRSFDEHYSRVNIWMTRQKELMVPGAVATGEMLSSEAELLASEWYNDWLRPQDLFHLMGGIVLKEGSWTSVFSSFPGTAMKDAFLAISVSRSGARMRSANRAYSAG
jgi:hypothetical protein